MSAEVGMVKSGLIHIISELGGWVVGLATGQGKHHEILI